MAERAHDTAAVRVEELGELAWPDDDQQRAATGTNRMPFTGNRARTPETPSAAGLAPRGRRS